VFVKVDMANGLLLTIHAAGRAAILFSVANKKEKRESDAFIYICGAKIIK
jgi:hypothetical protein